MRSPSRTMVRLPGSSMMTRRPPSSLRCRRMATKVLDPPLGDIGGGSGRPSGPRVVPAGGRGRPSGAAADWRLRAAVPGTVTAGPRVRSGLARGGRLTASRRAAPAADAAAGGGGERWALAREPALVREPAARCRGGAAFGAARGGALRRSGSAAGAGAWRCRASSGAGGSGRSGRDGRVAGRSCAGTRGRALGLVGSWLARGAAGAGARCGAPGAGGRSMPGRCSRTRGASGAGAAAGAAGAVRRPVRRALRGPGARRCGRPRPLLAFGRGRRARELLACPCPWPRGRTVAATALAVGRRFVVIAWLSPHGRRLRDGDGGCPVTGGVAPTVRREKNQRESGGCKKQV